MFNPQKLLVNSRFYILGFVFLGSIFAAATLRSQFVSDQLYYIRLEQLYGLLATVLVYSAVIITPLSKLAPHAKLTKRVLFARRAIGVGAAYFALLHIYITIHNQLGGLNGIGILPERFQLSFGLAAVAFIILIALAVTSFDKAMAALTFRRWKQLHRFVYLAGILIVIHIWLIGTHVEYAPIRYATYVALGVLLVLESFRLGAALQKRYKLDTAAYMVSVLLACVISVLALLFLSGLAQNYHSEHGDHDMAMPSHEAQTHDMEMHSHE